MEVRYPPTISVHQNVAFLPEAGGFGPLKHLPLVQYFHRKDFVRPPHPDDANFPESSSPDDLDDFKILPSQLQAFDTRGDWLDWNLKKKNTMSQRSIKRIDEPPSIRTEFNEIRDCLFPAQRGVATLVVKDK